MKSLFPIMAALAGFLFLSPAHADPLYVSLGLGGDPTEIEDILGTSSITGLEIRGAVGWQFEAVNVRGEIQYTYLPSQKFDRDDSLFLMGYYDFGETLGATPFIGVGAGVALQGIDVEGGLGQVAAGVSYPFTESVSGTATCYYQVNINDFDNDSTSCTVGARFSF